MNVISTSRARWIGAVALTLALFGTLAVSTQATAAPTVAPSFGPTAGGSNVTVLTPQVTVQTFEAGFSGAFFAATTGETFGWGATASQFPSAGGANAPVQLSEALGVNFTHFGSSSTFAIALGDDGNIYGSGQGTSGQLGDGTFSAQSLTTATMPLGVSEFTGFAVGQFFVLAMGDDGVLYSWGANTKGQLGDGSTTNSGVPVAVTLPSGVSEFTQFAAGRETSYALGDDGVLYAWGANALKQLGAGPGYDAQSQVTAPVPVALPGGTVVSSIAATYNNGFALDENGALYAWGSDANGTLGTGGQTDVFPVTPVSTPAQTLMPSGVAAYSAVAVTMGGAIFALGDDEQWYSWGYNGYFELDEGGINRSTPDLVPTPNGVDFIDIVGGGYTAYAIGSDGLLYGWGLNGSGQVGAGSDETLLLQPTNVLLQHAAVSADFGGSAATSVTNIAGGSFTAITPAHGAGQVDITIDWTLNGVEMTPVTYPSSFLYTDVPPAGPTITMSGPAKVTITRGSSHKWNITVTEGDAPITSAPVVTSPDGVADAVTVTEDAVTFESAGLAFGSYGFTVTWTDENGIALSQPFTVTLTGSDDGGGDDHHKLPNTGGAELGWLGNLGALAALLGAAAMFRNVRTQRRSR